MSELQNASLAAVRAMIGPLTELESRVEEFPSPPELDTQVGDAGQRVLVVGPHADAKALAFAARGVAHVLACIPPDPVSESRPDAPGQHSLVELRCCDWTALDPTRDGVFDVVHCEGVLHCVSDPVALLRRLRAMTADGGTLLIGAFLLPDADQSELLRFVPEPRTLWWFVPGRLAFRWMVSTAGFEVEVEFGEREGPRDRFPVVSSYLRAHAIAP